MGRPVAFVTGASRGIGKAAAIALARAGFDVAVSARTMRDGEGRFDLEPDRPLPGGLDTTVAAIEAAGGTGFAVRMDVLDRTSVLAAADAVLDRFGRVDVLVNNAIHQGRGIRSVFTDTTVTDLAAVFEGNVLSQVVLIRRLLGHVSTVVNMISAVATLDPPGKVGQGGWSAAYAMSKAAFARLVPVLHVEHPDVRWFNVDPGFVRTERMEAAGLSFDYPAAAPEDIARVLVWLVTHPTSDVHRGKTVVAQRIVPGR